MRDMVPDAGGEALAIADGQTLTFERSTTVGAGWGTDELGLVVFVQRDSDREVLQTGTTFE